MVMVRVTQAFVHPITSHAHSLVVRQIAQAIRSLPPHVVSLFLAALVAVRRLRVRARHKVLVPQMLPAETLSRTQSRAKQTESAHLFDHFGNVGREMMHWGTASEPSVLAARRMLTPEVHEMSAAPSHGVRSSWLDTLWPTRP